MTKLCAQNPHTSQVCSKSFMEGAPTKLLFEPLFEPILTEPMNCPIHALAPKP